MSRTRTEARMEHTGRGTAFALVGVLALVAGCAHAPRPRAEVPTDTTRTAGRTATTTKRAAPAVTKETRETKEPKEKEAAVPAIVPGVSSGSSTSQPVVVPQLPAAEQERLERETKLAMETAQKALDGIDVAKLDAEKNRKFVIAKDFLVQAAEARTNKEFERAQGLAQKARLLAEELAPH